MKLYYNPRSRAAIAKWMLDECGADHEIIPVDLEKREHKTPEFLKINPAGKLPALVDGPSKIFEGADCSSAANEVAGATSNNEPCSSVAATRQASRSTQPVVQDLPLVHRRL